MSPISRKKFSEYRKNLSEECLARTDQIVSNDGQHQFDLDEHQESGMLEVASALKAGKDHFSVVWAGGTGKTVLEAAVIQASQAAKAPFNGEFQKSKDLVLTVERSLTNSVRDHIAQVLNQDVGIWAMGKKELEPNVIVASVQALQRQGDRLKKYIDPKEVSLVLGDEADKFLTESRQKLLAQFDSAIHIGLTATPQWQDGRHINEAWGEIVHELSLREGIKRGINVPPMYSLYEASFDVDDVKVQANDFESDSLAAALKAIEIELAIPEVYESIVPEKRRKKWPTLVYVPSVSMVGNVTDELKKKYPDINITSWTGSITSARLSREIQDFREGNVDILVLCEMGGRGLNLPRARCIIDAFPTLSANKLEQRHARVLRRVRKGSQLAEQGYQKPFAHIAQIIPKSNSYRPVTLLDILNCWPDYRPGKVITFDKFPDLGVPGDGPSMQDEVDEVVANMKKHPLRSKISLMEQVDVLRQLQLLEDLPQADEDGFIYLDE